MNPNPRPESANTDRYRARTWRGRALKVLGALGLAATAWGGDSLGPLEGPNRVSLKESDRGEPRAAGLAMHETLATPLHTDPTFDAAVQRTEGPADSGKPATAKSREGRVPRVATATGGGRSGANLHEARSTATVVSAAEDDAIQLARDAIAACQARFREVEDYTCIFHKRERIDGRLHPPHVMAMKSRTKPQSVYFKFQQPNKGREAIYVAGRHGGKILAHDVGWGKLLAGTMTLDPKGSMAMDENRHPVTEAGIGALIETVAHRWGIELTPGESRVTIQPSVRVGQHSCRMIESVHPAKAPEFLFHMVKLYIDHEHGLPIRFEAYDWPKHTGAAPELVEEYTYLNLRVNVGLRDRDFDVANPQYSYGRF